MGYLNVLTGIAILFQWIREMELYYPKFIREIIIINGMCFLISQGFVSQVLGGLVCNDLLTSKTYYILAPSVTQIALNALKPAMSQETTDILHIFNMDKRIWMEYLDRMIDRSQREPSKRCYYKVLAETQIFA